MNTAPCFRLLIVLTMMSWGPFVFSQEVKRFVVPNGKSLLGIQFKHGGNTVAELFPSPPEGFLIFTYDCGYYDNQFAFGKWVHPEQTLEPGQGVMIDNPGNAFTLRFLTEEIVTSWEMKIRAGKNLLALPESGMDSIDVRPGDRTVQFSLDTYTWRTSTFDELDQAWLPEHHLSKVGEAFFYIATDSEDRPERCAPEGLPVYLNNYLPTNDLREPFEYLFGSPDATPSQRGLASGTSFGIEVWARTWENSLMNPGTSHAVDKKIMIGDISFLTGLFAGYIDTSMQGVSYLDSDFFFSQIQIRGVFPCTKGYWGQSEWNYAQGFWNDFWPFTFTQFGWMPSGPRLSPFLRSYQMDGKIFIVPTSIIGPFELDYLLSDRFGSDVVFRWQRWSPGSHPDRGWETFAVRDSDGISMDSITFTDPVFEAYRVLVDYGCVQNELLLNKMQRIDSAQVFPVIDSVAVSANQGGRNYEPRSGERAVVTVGETISFKVSATGLGPLSFQWLKDRHFVPGGTNAEFIITNVQDYHSGTYAVRVSNPLHSSWSSAVLLEVSHAGNSTGDFGSDGKADIIFQDEEGTLAAWQMESAGILSASVLDPSKVNDRAYRVAGSADFNQDGKEDLLFQHKDGTLAVWFMDGIKLDQAVFLEPSNPGDPNWRVVSAADINRDGSADIVFQHDDGTLAVWYLKGTSLKRATLFDPSTPGDRNWKVVGTGDFSGDQNVDLVFQRTDGTLAVWLLEATSLKESRLFSPSNFGTAWRVVSAVDRNQDGKPDLLFQHTNLDLAVWFMNGTNLKEARLLEPRNPGGTWKVVAPR